MATDLPAIRQRITVDDSALSGLGGRFRGVARTLGKVVAGGAAIAAGAVGAFVVQGVRGAIDVDRGLREVVTLFGDTGDAADATFDEMAAGVRSVSDEIGIAQDTLTGGLYQAISAGVPRDNVFEFMEVAGRAAIGGVTDVETAVDGLTTVINAWGEDAEAADAIADSMFTAVKGGKTTFEELSASLFQVAPAAASAGIGYDQVNAAIATLTAAGTPTAVATTQIRQALVELDDPTKRASKAFAEISGTTFREFIASGGDVQGALAILQDEAEETGASIGDYFGSVEASAAASALGATNAEKFAEELENQANSAGAADDAFGEMEKSTARQMERLRTNLANVGIEIGSRLLPTINRIVEWATTHLPPAMEAGARAFGTVRDAIRPVVDAIRPLLEIVGTVATYFRARLNGGVMEGISALRSLPEPIQAIVRPIGELLGRFRVLVARFRDGSGEMGERVAALRDQLAPIFAQIGQVITSAMDAIVAVVRFAAEIVSTVWERSGERILAFARSTWDNLVGLIGGVLDVLIGIFEVFAGLFTGDWSRLWEGVKQIASGLWKAITAIFRQAINIVRTVVSVGISAIIGLWRALWPRLRALASGAWTALVGIFRSNLDRAVAFVRALPGRIMTVLRVLPGLLLGLARRALGQMRSGVSSGASSLIGFVRGLPRRILGALGNVGRMLFGAGKAILQGLVRGIRSVASAPANAVRSVVSGVRRLLPFSPAKEGPLSGKGSPDRAGATIGTMLADGLRSSAGQVAAAASGVASAAQVRPGAGTIGTVDGSAGDRRGANAGVSQTFHVEAFDVREAARELSSEMAYSGALLSAPRG